MDDWTQTMGAAPLLLIALAAVLAILLLVIRFKVHAFIVLILVSVVVALVTMPAGLVLDALVDSFSSTLGTVALLVGLGAMLGSLVEFSGGARALADAMIRLFGERRAPLALGVASLFMGFPMFFDAGLVVMLPVIFAVGRRLDNNILKYGIPAAAAFSGMHVFVPPHPGPVTATELYGANLGLVLLFGLIIVIPTWYLSGVLWGRFISSRVQLPIPGLFGSNEEDESKADFTPPPVLLVIAILAIPMLLIFLNTGLDALRADGLFTGEETWYQLATTVGSAPIALLISVIIAALALGAARGESGNTIEKVMDNSLGPIASVVLITGAGGMFGGILQASGIGDALSDALSGIGLPVIVAAYIIAVAMRIAQGSATVALVTAAGLMAPAVTAGDFSSVEIVAIVLATAAGSTIASHVNDSGFWLVGRLMGMNVKQTLTVWTTQQTIQSIIGFALAYVIYLLA